MSDHEKVVKKSKQRDKKPNRVAELASIISENVGQVNRFLSEHRLPDLSFDRYGHSFEDEPAFAQAREAALEACEELQYLLAGPTRSLLTKNVPDAVNLQAICHFNLATEFPKSEDGATYEELSQVSKLPEADVRRIIRGAMANHVFKEDSAGRVKHTAASRMLANTDLMRQWIGMYTEEMMPAGLNMVKGMVTWPNSQKPNHAGYNLANNTNEICWDYMEKFPDRVKRFGDAMSLFALQPSYGPHHLIKYLEEQNLTKGTLVDVGGSHGGFSMDIASKFRDIKCIVQDRPDVIETARKDPIGHLFLLDDQIDLMNHDFFEDQPVRDADVFLLRWILHDWSDEYAIRILRALVPAMKRGTRVLIHEYIVPEPSEDSYIRQQSMWTFDFYMRALCNGKERDVGDWKALLWEADSKFRIRYIGTPPGSSLGIIDVEWDG